MDRALSELKRLKLDYSPETSATRKRILSRLARTRMTTRDIAEAHALLLFLRAYPDTKTNLSLTQRALLRIAKQAAKNSDAFPDLGILGTDCSASFTPTLLEWLARENPNHLHFELDDEEVSAELDDFLREHILRVSSDAVLNRFVTTGELLARFSRRKRGGQVAWLLSSLRQLYGDTRVLDKAFDALNLFVKWRVSHPKQSLTFLKLTSAKPSFLRELRAPLQVREMVATPLKSWRKLPRREAERVISQSRWSLALRGKETDPVTYADPREVYLCDTGDGIEVALFSMLPERRLPLESYIGYVAARSGVPIAYGGAWILGPRAEIGLNIFEEFRGGDSRLLFTELLRVYSQLFQVTQFSVPPYQLGDDNEDGLKSGAFWFYYRLGFRPQSASLKKLAAAEYRARELSRRYRTPLPTMKKLAAQSVFWSVDPKTAPFTLDLPQIGFRLAAHIGDRYQGDQLKAESGTAARMGRAKGRRTLSPLERRSLNWMAPLAELIRAERWPQRERAALARIFALKRSGMERDYLLAVLQHSRFLRALQAIG